MAKHSRAPAVLIGLAGAMLIGTVSAEPTEAQRISAAKRTAATHPLCSARVLNSYYWEIGNQGGPLVSGSVTLRNGRPPVTADTVMGIASASKWIYAAYAVEKFGDELSGRPFLNLTSGYSNFRTSDCPTGGTVAECKPGTRNRSEANGKIFHYDGGHMQRHAIDMGLGSLGNESLAVEIGTAIGSDTVLGYVQPALAGGGSTTARQYAGFLRKLMPGTGAKLQLGALLGSNPVCTLPSPTCIASRLTAVPEAWHYSLGHWIEDDPSTTPELNFAYSSPGSFGFYPWVDTSRTWYGVLARQTEAFTGVDEGYASVKCGRLLRLAWKTGVPQ
jgi:CubicO group peptidase (beta-lactamase class C family)